VFSGFLGFFNVMNNPIRLQKVLAQAGIASRRACEALILAGRVAVNGQIVQVLGTQIDPAHDILTVDAKPVQLPTNFTYLLLNKPVGVVSTANDPQGRPTVVDLVAAAARLFPIGRLDAKSEGLLLLTDDGDLTYRLTHPKFQVEKEYHALLDRELAPEAQRLWRTGVRIAGQRTAPAQVATLTQDAEGGWVWVKIVLREGRKRQIRDMARVLGYTVLRLIRVREGPLLLGNLPVGQWRTLSQEEVQALQAHSLLSPAQHRDE